VQAGFVWEPYTTELVNRGYKVLFSSTQISSLYPDLITFRADVVKERPEDVRAFLRAWFEAAEYRLTHVKETRDIVANFLGMSPDDILPDDQLYVMTLSDNERMYQHSPDDGSRSIFDTAQISADFLIGIGTLSTQPALETIFDPSYLK
jgi:NitT/TauT family transport system substrate-binding protein